MYVGENLWLVDLWERGNSGYSSGYIYTGEKKAVIEPGPAQSVPQILHQLDNLGLSRQEITNIIVTHIHLDHAGGAGRLAQELPAARVLVHHRGARHLIDPGRLQESASLAWGLPVEKVFGELVPLAPERVVPLRDGDQVDLGGGHCLTVLETPGHAPHHLCLYDGARQALFAGDALGIYYPAFERVLGIRFFHPVTPRPDFDLLKMQQDICRLAQLEIETVYYTHFGPVYGPAGPLLEQAAGKLALWEKLVPQAWEEEPSVAHVTGVLFDQLVHSFPEGRFPEDAVLGAVRGTLLYMLHMAAEGFINYLQQTTGRLTQAENRGHLG